MTDCQIFRNGSSKECSGTGSGPGIVHVIQANYVIIPPIPQADRSCWCLSSEKEFSCLKINACLSKRSIVGTSIIRTPISGERKKLTGHFRYLALLLDAYDKSCPKIDRFVRQTSGGSRISRRGVLIYGCARSASEFLEATPTFDRF